MENELITIERPGPPAIVAELAPIVALARAFEVNDLETNRQALEAVRRLRAGEKGIQDHFAKSIKDAHAAHKSILSAVAALTGPIAEARSIFDQKTARYESAERIKAQEEARRLQEEARRAEEERTLMDAINAEADGDNAAAEAILAEPVSAPVVIVAPQIAKVAGLSEQTRWSAEVTDLARLVSHVAKHPELINLLVPNDTALNALARAQQAALAIPGVRAVPTTTRIHR